MERQGETQAMKVLIAGAALQLFLGVIYVWSVFVMPVAQYFNREPGEIKLTSSFMLSFFVLGILAGGKLQQRITTQKTVLAGGTLLALGMLISAFLPVGQGLFIYLTYGVMGGFGVGMGYNAIITTAQRNFPKNRGLATGVSVCAFGFSTVIFAPLVEYLCKTVGVQYTFVILAAAYIVVVLALFSFIKMPESSGATAQAAFKGKQYTVSEILRTKEFYCITLSLMLGTSVYFILNPSFKTLAAERGLSDGIATVLVMLTGVANALGRLGVPLLSDKIGRERAAFVTIAVTAICAIALIFVGGTPLIFIIAVIAFCYGGYSGIYPVITGDYFGLANVGSNYGAVMVGFAASALLFPIVMNMLSDMTVKFVVLAVGAVIGAALTLLLKRKG